MSRNRDFGPRRKEIADRPSYHGYEDGARPLLASAVTHSTDSVLPSRRFYSLIGCNLDAWKACLI